MPGPAREAQRADRPRPPIPGKRIPFYATGPWTGSPAKPAPAVAASRPKPGRRRRSGNRSRPPRRRPLPRSRSWRRRSKPARRSRATGGSRGARRTPRLPPPPPAVSCRAAAVAATAKVELPHAAPRADDPAPYAGQVRQDSGDGRFRSPTSPRRTRRRRCWRRWRWDSRRPRSRRREGTAAPRVPPPPVRPRRRLPCRAPRRQPDAVAAPPAAPPRRSSPAPATKPAAPAKAESAPAAARRAAGSGIGDGRGLAGIGAARLSRAEGRRAGQGRDRHPRGRTQRLHRPAQAAAPGLGGQRLLGPGPGRPAAGRHGDERLPDAAAGRAVLRPRRRGDADPAAPGRVRSADAGRVTSCRPDTNRTAATT